MSQHPYTLATDEKAVRFFDAQVVHGLLAAQELQPYELHGRRDPTSAGPHAHKPPHGLKPRPVPLAGVRVACRAKQIKE